MITSVAERHEHAVQAVDDFLSQDWPHKELVIVNTTGISFPRHTHVIDVDFASGSPADLLEAGTKRCSGEWVAEWPDTCRFDSRYLRILARFKKVGSKVCLRRFSACVLDTDEETSVDNCDLVGLSFRLSPLSDDVVWIDKPEMLTRLYATKKYKK
jgi:hypothetical protein